MNDSVLEYRPAVLDRRHGIATRLRKAIQSSSPRGLKVSPMSWVLSGAWGEAQESKRVCSKLVDKGQITIILSVADIIKL